MPASIFGERFYGRREPAWHGLGTVFDGQVTAEEAVESAGCAFQVNKQPLFYYDGSDYHRVEERVALVREQTTDAAPAVFGLVTENYQVVQNTDIARIISPLAAEWPIETVGALGDGETIFFTLDAGGSEIAGDEIRRFFLVTDTKTGGGSLKVAFTPVRVVCQNTLTTSLRQASATLTITHLHDPAAELELASAVVKAANLAQAKVEAALTALASINVDEEAIKQILHAAYPLPKESRYLAFREIAEEIDSVGLSTRVAAAEERLTYYTSRVEAFREGATELYRKFCDEHSELAYTPWAIYNAIVESEDWRRGAESVSESLLFGARAKTKARAFDAALVFVN